MPTKLTTEQFIERANLKHNNKYDYAQTVYTHSKNKVKINCPSHGIWEQTPNCHLKGRGCPLCSGNKATQAKASSEFISRSQEIHGDKYDYSLVEYIGIHSKVTLVCPAHGIFEQSPGHHLNQKQGCPVCALSETGWSRTGFVQKCIKNNNGLGILYVLECFNDSEKFIKIGITSLSVKERYRTNREMPYAYRVIDEIIGDPEYIFDLEKALHKQHKQYQYTPIIPFGGSSTECFKQYLNTKHNNGLSHSFK